MNNKVCASSGESNLAIIPFLVARASKQAGKIIISWSMRVIRLQTNCLHDTSRLIVHALVPKYLLRIDIKILTHFSSVVVKNDFVVCDVSIKFERRRQYL